MMSEKDMENLGKTKKIDDNLISTETLHGIRDGNQTHTKLIKGKHVLQYVIVLSKINLNGKER